MDTVPNGSQLATSPMTRLRTIARSEDTLAKFSEVLGKQYASAYVSSILIAVANNSELQKCEPASIITSAMRAATMQLSCDPALGQAHLVPFGGKATLVIGYKGLRDLAYRTGKYRDMNVARIYDGQTVEEDQLTGRHTVKGYRNKQDSPVIGYLAYFALKDGFSKTLYMTVGELTEHAKNYSRGYNNPKGVWKQNPDAMMAKTVLRLLLTRWGVMDPKDRAMLAEIEPMEGDVIDGQVEYVEDDVDTRPAETSAETEARLISEVTGEPVVEGSIKTEQPAAQMDLATAEAIIGSDEKRYGDCTSDELSRKLIGIRASLKKTGLTDEQREGYQFKQDAINLILTSRNAVTN